MRPLHRSVPLLQLLAGSARLLRRQRRGGRSRQEEVLARSGGLPRVPAPQEGGASLLVPEATTSELDPRDIGYIGASEPSLLLLPARNSG